MNQTEIIPSLDRTASLGEIYDIRTDRFTRINVFSRNIPEVCRTVTEKHNSESDFVISNKTSDKLNSLDIHGEFAINIMYGLVPVSGSAKFINEKKSKKQEVQCNFLQKMTTFDEIINYKHESLRDCYAQEIENEGTHVVIGISWGANAVVTFTYENDEHMAKNEFKEKLKLDLENLKTWASRRGEVGASYKDNLSLLSNQMRIKTNADVVANHEGAPRSLEEALEFIHNLPKRMAETNNGKGRQIAFHLIPLSTLKKYLQHNDTIDVVVQQIESSSITRLRQLFDDIEGAEEDLVDLLNLSRSTSFVVPADSNQIADFYQNFQAGIDQFKSSIRTILTEIKPDKIEPYEIDDSRAVFSKTSEFSPRKVKEFVESCSNIKEKIAFCKNFLQHGIRYISNNEELESFKRYLCDVNCVEAYVFVGSFKQDRNEEEWRQAIDIFYTIQNEKPTGTVFAYIDKDFSFSRELPTGIKICKFRNGSFINNGILEQYLKREEISTFISYNKLTPNLNSNRNRVNFKAKCPETYNNGDCERIEHEWICMACNELLTYGFDQRFYCGCGNGAISDFAFKCSSPKHGKNHVKYEPNVLENIVSKLKSRKEINILLMGETGVGKSTWINLIPNYLKYETLNEVANGQFISLIPTEFVWTTTNNGKIESREIKAGTPDNNEVFKDKQSSTQKPKAYEFKVEDTIYRIIDTPGIGDTRGIDHDKQNTENILTFISHYGELHAICILLPPNVSKFSTSFVYCFKALLTQFHKSAANNVFFCFTNTQGYGFAPAETFSSLQQLLLKYQSAIEIPLNEYTMYSYDNIAYRYLCAIQKPYQITLSSEKVETYRQSYQISRQETNRMFRTIREQTPYLVNNSLSIYYSRKVISNLALPLTILATNTPTIFETILLFLQLLFLPSSWKKYSEFDHMNFYTSKQVCCNKCVKKHKINLKDILENNISGKEVILWSKEVIPWSKGDSLKKNNLPAGILRQIKIFNKTGRFEDFSMYKHLTERPNQPYIYFEYNELKCDSLGREFCPNCSLNFERKEIERKIITYEKKQVSDEDVQKINNERLEERDELVKEIANFAIFLKRYSIAPYNDSTEDYIQILIKNEEQNNDKQKVEKYEELLKKYQEEKKRLDKALEVDEEPLLSDFSSQLTTEKIMEKLKRLTRLKHNGHIIEQILKLQEDEELYDNIEKDEENNSAMPLEFAIGCLQTFLAVILLGSTYVPIKKYNTFEGIFCLFLLATATFMVGCIVFAIQDFEPKVYPLAMLSGAIGTIGNTSVIPIIKRISLAVAYLVWNTTNCIIGWGITYFGLFGIIAKPAAIPWMNFSGVAIVLMGGIIMAFVKEEEEETSNTSSKNSIEDDSTEKLPTPMMIEYQIKLRIDEKINPEPKIVVGNKKLNFYKQQIIGVVMAALAGCVFGIVWTPMFYMQDHADEFDNASKDLLPYLFSNFLGMFITATLEFAIYSVVKKNKPKISPELVLPGLASGILFGTAQVFMCGATQTLTASITYPIVSTMHGLVAASWSIFYFKEGKRNYTIMATAVCVNLTGSTLIALSK